MRTYEELLRLKTFEERFTYLKLDGSVGKETFGSRRALNQTFYHSKEWKNVRDRIIVRDMGLDLAHQDYPIVGRIYIHHLNPILPGDFSLALDPENLICTSFDTHQAIHYGDATLISQELVERRPNDTCPWKQL